jgi:formylglycine-generating enzyme required for sulfatase activity
MKNIGLSLLLFLTLYFFQTSSLAILTAYAKEPSPQNMVFILAGTFVSGPPSKPKSRYIDTFYIDRFEVTQKDFEKVMNHNPSFFIGLERPAEKITWYDAKGYCEKVEKRLPTEWEWEKAVRGGTETLFFWGDEMDGDYAWDKSNANKQTQPIGQKKPNAFGLHDMAGNVWEWTSSDHDNSGKVLRGGSWRNSSSSLRSAHRIGILPNQWFHYVGFRCALHEMMKSD